MLKRLLDLLYPPRCVLCHSFLEHGETEVCCACGKRVLEQQYRQRSLRTLSRCVSLFPYEGVFRESITRFKFGGRPFYADAYAKWLAALIRTELDGTFDLITWAPVSRKRKRKRGYDQTELLCRGAAKLLGKDVVRALEKTRDNPAQSTMKNAEARHANIKNVYAAADPDAIRGRRVLLMDDILTTGATLEVCARTLLRAGAKEIVGCTLASV